MRQMLFEALEIVYRRIEPRTGLDELKMMANCIEWAKKLEEENNMLRKQIDHLRDRPMPDPNIWTTQIPVGMKVGAISFVPAN